MMSNDGVSSSVTVVSIAESFDAVLEKFSFLVGYNNELAGLVAGASAEDAFHRWTELERHGRLDRFGDRTGQLDRLGHPAVPHPAHPVEENPGVGAAAVEVAQQGDEAERGGIRHAVRDILGDLAADQQGECAHDAGVGVVDAVQGAAAHRSVGGGPDLGGRRQGDQFVMEQGLVRVLRCLGHAWIHDSSVIR